MVQPSFGRGIAVDVDALDLVGRIILHKLQGRIYLGQFAGIAIALGVEACLVDGVEEEGVALFTAGRESAGHAGLGRGLECRCVESFLLQYLLAGQHAAAVAAGHFLQQAEAGIVHPRLVGHGGVIIHQTVLLAVAGQYAIGILCFRTVQSLGAVLDGPHTSVGYDGRQGDFVVAVVGDDDGCDDALVLLVDDVVAQVEGEAHRDHAAVQADGFVAHGGHIVGKFFGLQGSFDGPRQGEGQEEDSYVHIGVHLGRIKSYISG